jgi:hypothetical protein
MMKRFEAEMIEPIRELMRQEMNLDIISEEFTAGYGVADLIGAVMSEENCQMRDDLGLAIPFDDMKIVEILLLLRTRGRTSLSYLINRISFSEGTFRIKILPKMISYSLIKKDSDGYISLLVEPPHPTEGIVAVEAKQTKWREAILQARRYTFFAEQTYIAVWNGTAKNVDRHFLYKNRLGLIGVEPDGAEILLEAPKRKPRKLAMNRFCAEYLYRKTLDSE